MMHGSPANSLDQQVGVVLDHEARATSRLGSLSLIQGG
jgi:hypothetical protein